MAAPLKKKPTSRKLQAERTKQKLIDAGTQLIKNAYYDDISIEDITALCGVSKGTFYVHFDSKDQFFYSICHANYEKLNSILTDESIPSYLERIRKYIKAWVDINKTMSRYFMQNWYSHLFDADYHADASGSNTLSDEFKKALITCLDNAKKAGEIISDAPIEDMADFILINLYGFDLYHTIQHQRMDVSAWKRDLSTLVVDRYLKNPLP